MITPEMVRCKKCPHRVEEDGTYICDLYDEEIEDITDEDCEDAQSW